MKWHRIQLGANHGAVTLSLQTHLGRFLIDTAGQREPPEGGIFSSPVIAYDSATIYLAPGTVEWLSPFLLLHNLTPEPCDKPDSDNLARIYGSFERYFGRSPNFPWHRAADEEQ